MKPLNLAAHAPRKPSVRLAGVIFLARTVDKIRASLPGGDLGAYKVDGFSTRTLKHLGITADELRDVVAKAPTEADVEHFILEHSTQEQRDAANADNEKRTVGQYMVELEGFADRYPIVKELPPETTILEMLERDDQLLFARS